MKFFTSNNFKIISAAILLAHTQAAFSQCACQSPRPQNDAKQCQPQQPTKGENVNPTNTKITDQVTAEISVGELIDKITILMIKVKNITDSAKLENIRTELRCLTKTRDALVPHTKELDDLTNQLLEINKKLWAIEDDIRDKERHKCFDTEFIELARSVYYTNDERCKIKRKINDSLGSRLIEEKSYTAY